MDDEKDFFVEFSHSDENLEFLGSWDHQVKELENSNADLLKYHGIEDTEPEEHSKNIWKPEQSGNTNEDPLECLNFKTPINLEEVDENTSENRKSNSFQCEYCEFNTSEQYYLSIHRKRVHLGESFDHNDFQKTHLQLPSLPHNQDREKEKFTCELCNFSTVHSHYLEKHFRRIHLKERGYECVFCNYGSFEEKGLKIHMETHHNVSNMKKYSCDRCEYSTSHSGHFEAHFRRFHLSLKDYKCNFCDYSAFEKRDLKLHIESQHETDFKKYECKHCQYSSLYLEDFKIHVKTHSKERNVKCGFCNFSAFDEISLSLHMDELHKDSATFIQIFKCKFCEFSSVYQTSLGDHMKTFHSDGGKLFECLFCSCFCRDIRELNYHMKSYHDNSGKKMKKLKCQLCEFTTDYHTSLRRHHRLIHLKEKLGRD